MKGGYQILDLTGLDLEIKDIQTSISDPKILKQLDYLKSYIEEGYDFTKPLNNQLKPILLRIRDKESEEKQEASVWANLSKKTDNLTFVIEGIVNSNVIQIEIVFELKQDEVDNYYYGIKTAKYLFIPLKEELSEFLFDGEVKAEYSVPNYVIRKAELPTKVGIYKLYRILDSAKSYMGFLVITVVHSSDMSFFGIWNNKYFEATNHTISSNYYTIDTQGFLDTKANPTLEGTESALTGFGHWAPNLGPK